jgi:hypothetical protein
MAKRQQDQQVSERQQSAARILSKIRNRSQVTDAESHFLLEWRLDNPTQGDPIISEDELWVDVEALLKPGT